MNKGGFVYILASKPNGTLYIGVSSDLGRRIYQHKTSEVEAFTSKYKVHKLVWYETHDRIEEAILREKQLKKWKRAWKLKIIEEFNPNWKDLYDDIA